MNRTVEGARAVHGGDPQMLVSKILRERVYESAYWREFLIGFPLESVLERAEELEFVGGCIANQRPSPFVCLLLKLLQLGCTYHRHCHSGDAAVATIDRRLLRSDNKYTVALGLFLVRMTCEEPAVLYTVLETFLSDRRRIKWRLGDGSFCVRHVDEFVESLLGYHRREESGDGRVCDVMLPRVPGRCRLVADGRLAAREPLVNMAAVAAAAAHPRSEDIATQQPAKLKRKKEKWRL